MNTPTSSRCATRGARRGASHIARDGDDPESTASCRSLRGRRGSPQRVRIPQRAGIPGHGLIDGAKAFLLVVRASAKRAPRCSCKDGHQPDSRLAPMRGDRGGSHVGTTPSSDVLAYSGDKTPTAVHPPLSPDPNMAKNWTPATRTRRCCAYGSLMAAAGKHRPHGGHGSW